MIHNLVVVPETPMTYWQMLTVEEEPMTTLTLGSTQNTESSGDGVYIPRILIGDWSTASDDPFPDYLALEAYAKESPEIWQVLQSYIENCEYGSVIATPRWELVDETALEINLKEHFDR